MFIVRSSTVAACAVAIAACAHTPPLHSARLDVQESQGACRVMVRVKVAGEPISLILDTGASANALPARFLRARGITPTSPGWADAYRDANGNVTYLATAHGVPVQFEGEAAGGKLDFVANPAFDDFGILSPQQLVSSGHALVIDMERAELRHETEEAAVRRVAAEAGAPLQELAYRKCSNEDMFREYHRVVSVSINGIPAEMMIDTGAARTMLARNNPAIQSLLERKGDALKTAGVTSVGTSLLLPDVPLQVAGTPFQLPVYVNRSPMDCGKGLLGADVLRHCVLVWGSSSLWAACRAPAAGKQD